MAPESEPNLVVLWPWVNYLSLCFPIHKMRVLAVPTSCVVGRIG